MTPNTCAHWRPLNQFSLEEKSELERLTTFSSAEEHPKYFYCHQLSEMFVKQVSEIHLTSFSSGPCCRYASTREYASVHGLRAEPRNSGISRLFDHNFVEFVVNGLELLSTFADGKNTKKEKNIKISKFFTYFHQTLLHETVHQRCTYQLCLQGRVQRQDLMSPRLAVLNPRRLFLLPSALSCD